MDSGAGGSDIAIYTSSASITNSSSGGNKGYGAGASDSAFTGADSALLVP
jgi:hypothetical protein